MTPQEFRAMKVANQGEAMSAMSDEELEQLRLACWSEAKAAEAATGEMSKLRNTASLIAMVQTQRKYA